MCKIEDYQDLVLDSEHRNYVNTELALWHRRYLPPGGVKGKNVLDLGAGCGETPWFYLLHGAASVRPIEMNPAKYQLMRENLGREPGISWEGPFKIDFIKSDCEGGEINMVVETHRLSFLEQFELVGRGPGGPAIICRLAPHEKTSNLLGWLHMKRISIAHGIALRVKSV